MSEQAKKTLGQVACEAYHHEIGDAQDMAQRMWDNNSSTYGKECWERAAQAVKDRVLEDQDDMFVSDILKRPHARVMVIAAAAERERLAKLVESITDIPGLDMFMYRREALAEWLRAGGQKS